ncbi:hypothetical protein [Priestia aryabhattai]|uniref:Uncharacterized protein n=1 Tax=Priestia aryabhattai TaxID=412384 RepID=A0ABD5KP45_PRIAR
MDSRKAMLMEMQKLIHEYSQMGNQLTNINKELVWQELNLTDEEALSLSSENLSPASIKAIEKIVKDNMMGLFHDFMCLVDGVSDPNDIEIDNDGVWLGLQILLITTSVMTLMMFLTIVLLPEIWHLSKNYMIAIGIYWAIVKCKTRVILISQIFAVIFSIPLMELFF